MFNPNEFLKLTIKPKVIESSQSNQSLSAISENCVTLNTYTLTSNTPRSIIDSQYSDIFQSTEYLAAPQYDNRNISELSLSSLPSIGYNNTNHSNHANQSSSHTITLNLSERANALNAFIRNDDNLSFDTINNASISHNYVQNNVIKRKRITPCKDKTDNMENKDNKQILNNIMNVNDVVDIESILLRKRGYKRGKKIATGLQGFIYELECIKDGTKYIVKKTDKNLHSTGITIQNGKKYAVKDDILNEKAILELITKQNPPQFIVKFIDFFESKDYYYLVMEHGGSDLFQFVIEAHKHIENGKLSLKEWRKSIKYIFWQMCVLLLWLHNTRNVCHLDVSLENLLVQNARFIDQGNGQLTISTNIQIKFCDFALAEFYDVDTNNLHTAYMSTKYCGKTNYKSPQVYSKKGKFDGRKADVWSLGVVLFCMAVGSPPYQRPNENDECFYNFIRKGHIAQLLYHWQRHHYITERMLSLIQSMLQYDEEKRYLIDDIIQHQWLKSYYSRYYELIKPDLLTTIYGSPLQKENEEISNDYEMCNECIYLSFIPDDYIKKAIDDDYILEIFPSYNELFYYLKWRSVIQANHGNLRVFNGNFKGNKQIVIFCTDLHEKRLSETIYVIGSKQYPEETMKKWKMSEYFMTANEIKKKYGINSCDLPSGLTEKFNEIHQKTDINKVINIKNNTSIEKYIHLPIDNKETMELTVTKTYAVNKHEFYENIKASNKFIPIISFNNVTTKYNVDMVLLVEVSKHNWIGIIFRNNNGENDYRPVCISIDCVDIRQKMVLFKPANNEHEYDWIQNDNNLYRNNDNQQTLDGQIMTEITDIIDDCIDKPQPDDIMYYLGAGNTQKTASKSNNKNNSQHSTDNDGNTNQQIDNTHNNNCGGGGDGNGNGKKRKDDDDDEEKKQNNHIDDDQNEEDKEEEKEEEEEEEESKDDKEIMSRSQLKLNVNATPYIPPIQIHRSVSTSSIPSSVTSSLSRIDEETPFDIISCDECISTETKQDIVDKSCRKSIEHKKRRKQNQSKKRLFTNEYSKKYENYAIYDAPSSNRARGNIQISRKFTKLLSTLISENISDIFCYIDKNTALQHEYEYNDGKIRIFNYDFHDNKSNEILYCIAERKNESINRGYKWRMKDRLFTNNDIQSIYGIYGDKLPKSIRAFDAFNGHNNNNEQIINQTINEKTKHMVNNTKWNKVPVYSKEPNRRICRTKLSITVQEFRKKMIYFIDNNKEKNKIFPIVMFKNNLFCIQYLWIITIKTECRATNIGVAFEYNMKQNMIKPVGMHLDKESIMNNRQLLHPMACDNDLRNFKSHFQDISIGNVDEDANLIKAQQFEINRLKEIIQQMTNNNSPSSSSVSYTEHSVTSVSSTDIIQ